MGSTLTSSTMSNRHTVFKILCAYSTCLLFYLAILQRVQLMAAPYLPAAALSGPTAGCTQASQFRTKGPLSNGFGSWPVFHSAFRKHGFIIKDAGDGAGQRQQIQAAIPWADSAVGRGCVIVR